MKKYYNFAYELYYMHKKIAIVSKTGFSKGFLIKSLLKNFVYPKFQKL